MFFFSKSVTQLLGIKQVLREVEVDEAIAAIADVIKIVNSFDPAILNDLAIYFGIKIAKELGIDTVATGDGSDELFCGYSYMKDLDNLERYIQIISKNMRFNSNIIGEYFGIKIIQPFLDRNVVDISLKIPSNLKIKEKNGKFFGK